MAGFPWNGGEVKAREDARPPGGLAFEGFDEGRDGTIERVGDGAEQFSLTAEDLAVGGDGLGAGEQDVSLHAGGGLRQPIEG